MTPLSVLEHFRESKVNVWLENMWIYAHFREVAPYAKRHIKPGRLDLPKADNGREEANNL